jgi:hypothetical protein
MYLKWTSTCYTCEAPLDPHVMTRGYVNKSFVRAYKRIRPIFLCNNRMYYSFVGLNLKRVCYCCFVNKGKVEPKLLRAREIGKVITRRSKAKTESEIVQWFDGLIRRAQVNNLNTTYTRLT